MRLLIWGTGELASHVIKNILESDIVGYIDSYKSDDFFAKKPLFKPDEVKKLEYDAILVSTIFAEEIAQTCLKYEIDLNKVIFVYGNVKSEDMNLDYKFIEKILGSKYAAFIKNRYHQIRDIDIDINAKKKDFDISDFSDKKPYRSDYIRVKTFELLVDEIRRGCIEGQVAELGVFQGEFAQFINAAFPDRKLYLFDTFEGFDEKELYLEWGNEYGIFAEQDTHKNTSVQIVMNRMKYQDNIIIKKGLFPHSLDGLDEKFAFVSLDCDYEESLYQGLEYFYPRLEKGGYIMMHDYNNFLTCAKKAIKRYEDGQRIKIPKVPIPDAQGSLILSK